jgi:hypothetical protein
MTARRLIRQTLARSLQGQEEPFQLQRLSGREAPIVLKKSASIFLYKYYVPTSNKAGNIYSTVSVALNHYCSNRSQICLTATFSTISAGSGHPWQDQERTWIATRDAMNRPSSVLLASPFVTISSAVPRFAAARLDHDLLDPPEAAGDRHAADEQSHAPKFHTAHHIGAI